jgi:ribosomal protein L11 methyltransferase
VRTLRGVQVVELVVEPGDAELAADALWQAGASAVSEEALEADRVRLRAEVESAARVDLRWPVVVVEPDTQDHLDAWRAFAQPRRAGPVVIQPDWLPDAPVAAGDVVVRLDPGRAFGSGSHPSTRLVIAAMAARLRPGDGVLDVGCGSGVLAIAAARLGAGEVIAVDVDPEARRATAENAARNGVTVAVTDALVTELGGRFELVLANIGAGTLVELSPGLTARTAHGGHLVLAGLLADRADEVAAAYPDCPVVDRLVEDGWVALVLRR